MQLLKSIHVLKAALKDTGTATIVISIEGANALHHEGMLFGICLPQVKQMLKH